jgi:hypothetical protein
MLKALGDPTRLRVIKTLAECKRCLTKESTHNEYDTSIRSVL